MNAVEKIRNQYVEKQLTKTEELKALNRKVKKPAIIFACIFGSIASLILGLGMSMAMKVIFDMMAIGIVIGVVGMTLCVANWYIYKAILSKRRNKYKEQILQISEEILKEE